MRLPPDQIMDLLGLQPHPTCGFYRETYRSTIEVPIEVLPRGYDGGRSLGGVLYFLVTSQAPVRLHRIRSDQMYHYYFGDPLEVLLLYPDGHSEVKRVGTDLRAGMRPQLLIPGGTFHAARVAAQASYSLLGTSVWLRAEPPDVEIGDAERLMASFPRAQDDIRAFAGH